MRRLWRAMLRLLVLGRWRCRRTRCGRTPGLYRLGGDGSRCRSGVLVVVIVGDWICWAVCFREGLGSLVLTE